MFLPAAFRGRASLHMHFLYPHACLHTCANTCDGCLHTQAHTCDECLHTQAHTCDVCLHARAHTCWYYTITCLSTLLFNKESEPMLTSPLSHSLHYSHLPPLTPTLCCQPFFLGAGKLHLLPWLLNIRLIFI